MRNHDFMSGGFLALNRGRPCAAVFRFAPYRI